MVLGILGAVAIGASIFSTVSQRKASKQQSETEEAIQKFNSAQTRREAQRLRKVGAEAEFELRRDLRRQLARNRVATAAAGVMPSDGTPLDTELLVIRDAAGDIATLEENIRLQSQELELLAQFQLQTATDVRRAGVVTRRSIALQGIGNVLGQLA